MIDADRRWKVIDATGYDRIECQCGNPNVHLKSVRMADNGIVEDVVADLSFWCENDCTFTLRFTTHEGDTTCSIEDYQRRQTQTEPTWYLLYEGSSPDGRGEGVYVKRTTDPAVARAHHAVVRSDPYSTGCVWVITDTAVRRVMNASEID